MKKADLEQLDRIKKYYALHAHYVTQPESLSELEQQQFQELEKEFQSVSVAQIIFERFDQLFFEHMKLINFNAATRGAAATLGLIEKPVIQLL